MFLFFGSASGKERKTGFRRLTIVTLMGIFFFGVRFGADHTVNGFERNVRITEIIFSGRIFLKLCYKLYHQGTYLPFTGVD